MLCNIFSKHEFRKLFAQHFSRGVADYVRHLLIYILNPELLVQAAYPFLCGFNNQTVSFLALPQRFFRLCPRRDIIYDGK